MNTNSPIMEVSLSKKKILLLTFGSIGFVAAGIWMWTIGRDGSSSESVFAIVIGFASIVFFGMTGIYGVVKLFDDNPGLIINQDGIWNNSNAVGGQLIRWADITNFNTTHVYGTRFLLIFVQNPDDYINSVNSFKGFWLKRNHKMFGTPLSISSNSLQCDFDELIDMINDGVEKYGV